MSLAVVVDDAALPQSAFAGGQWDHQNGQNGVLEGTVSTCRVRGGNGSNNNDDDDDDDPPQSLNLSFNGSDVSVYGTLTPGLAMNFAIDGSKPAPAQLVNSTLGKPGSQIFTLTGLGATQQHKLQLFPTAGQFIFDYFSSTATSSTNLTSAELLVDDRSPLIKYSSTGWTQANNVEYPTGSPYLRTATGASTAGSSLTLSFVGSSVSVIGATQRANGTLTASFTVDGQKPVSFNPFDGSQNVNASDWTVSQTLFQQQQLPPGTHQLTVTLDAVSGSQTLWIDAFIFKATNQTVLPTSTSTTSTPPPGGHSSKKFPAGAIVGIVIALLLALLLLGMYIRKWRGRGLRRYQRSKVVIDLNDTHPKAERPGVVMEEVPKMDQFMHARVQAAYRAARQHSTRRHQQDSSLDNNEPDSDEETAAMSLRSPYDAPGPATRLADPNRGLPSQSAFPTASQEKASRKETVLQWTPQPTVRNQSEDIAPSIANEIVATAALHAPSIAPVSPQPQVIPPALVPGRLRSFREVANGSASHLANSGTSTPIPPPAYDFVSSEPSSDK